MSIPQKKLREAVFQLMYGQDFSRYPQEEAVPVIMEQLSMSKKNARVAADRVLKIMDKWEDIDVMIEKVSTEYKVENLGSIERNILRLALFEVIFDPDIPEEVALSEALRLCKKFTIPESTRYVHAIISALSKKESLVS
jgi:transcription antitermination protein NusB